MQQATSPKGSGMAVLEIAKEIPNLRLAEEQSFAMIETVQFRGPKELWVEW